MLLAVSVVLLLIILRDALVRKEYIAPRFFWCGIWFVSTFFVWLNPFEMMEISEKAILTIALGIFSFILGTVRISRRKVRLNENRNWNVWHGDRFRKPVCCVLLAVTVVFNLSLTAAALSLLRSGVPYSSIRDILFGYGDQTISFFSSTFMSTFYSWIVGPSMSVLLIILILNVFVRQLPLWFSVVTVLDLALYVFSNSGRMLIMHAAVFLFFVYFFFQKQIPKKYRKLIIFAVAAAVGLLLMMTALRTKGSTGVPVFYSYFSIDYPLFSHWMQYVDHTGQRFYGNGFFKGILEGLNFFLGKMDVSTPLYWTMQDVFELVQNQWIEVFPGNWYNAYVSCFFYFYIDFGVPGVILGSFVFGKLATWVYGIMKRERSLISIVIYMILIQCVIDSFTRWQLGTFSYIALIFLALVSVKQPHKVGGLFRKQK